MAKLKPHWIKTDIPQQTKIELWRAMKGNPTYLTWTRFIAKNPELFDKKEGKEVAQEVPMSRDTYKRLQEEILNMPSHEVQSLPPDLKQWIRDLRSDLPSKLDSPNVNVKSARNGLDAIIGKKLEEHWNDLTHMASEAEIELPLPLNADDYPDATIDREGKTIELVSFRYSDVKWGPNTQGQVELRTERESPLLFSGLMAHLDLEFPGFKKRFENWRRDCTWYVGWNRPQRQWNPDDDIFKMSPTEYEEYKARPEVRIEFRKHQARRERLQDNTDYLVGIFKRVAARRTFKGTCEICKDM